MRDSVTIRRSIQQAESWLRSRDRRMARLIEQHGPCTLYADNALIRKTAFHVLVWSIINQQLSVASARSIERRLLGLHRRNTFQHATIAALADADLRACGLSRQKIRYLRELCDSIASGELTPSRLSALDNLQVEQRLRRVPGIGPWTVDMFLMFYLARLDVLPLGDLALRKAISITYDLGDDADTDRMAQLGRRWAPYRTVASWYLWCAVD